MNYQKRIKDLRIDSDMTQDKIAIVLKTSQRVYSRYETGYSEMPIRHLITLCRYYDVSADYILGFTDELKPLPKR